MTSYEEKYAYLERHIDDLKTNKTGDEKQTDAEVFDKQTLLTIYDFMTSGLVDSVHYPVSTGKEGNVFYVTDKDDCPLAMKIFRTSTSTFKKYGKYIEGDPRFKGITGNKRKMIYAWTGKEFRNLQRYSEAKIRVPEPIDYEKNCLLMEYIGDENGPAPLLKDVVLEEPDKMYKEVIGFVKNGFKKAHLVHGDLSEYNILVWEGEPILIDCGQSLTADHFNAKDFLLRDIANVNRFFRNKGVKVESEESLMKKITGGKQ